MKDIFDPRSYGAMADGHSKDTATVQAAICLLYTSDAADEL